MTALDAALALRAGPLQGASGRDALSAALRELGVETTVPVPPSAASSLRRRRRRRSRSRRLLLEDGEEEAGGSAQGEVTGVVDGEEAAAAAEAAGVEEKVEVASEEKEGIGAVAAKLGIVSELMGGLHRRRKDMEEAEEMAERKGEESRSNETEAAEEEEVEEVEEVAANEVEEVEEVEAKEVEEVAAKEVEEMEEVAATESNVTPDVTLDVTPDADDEEANSQTEQAVDKQEKQEVVAKEEREQMRAADEREEVATAEEGEQVAAAEEREEVAAARGAEEVPAARGREEVTTARGREEVTAAAGRREKVAAADDGRVRWLFLDRAVFAWAGAARTGAAASLSGQPAELTETTPGVLSVGGGSSGTAASKAELRSRGLWWCGAKARKSEASANSTALPAPATPGKAAPAASAAAADAAAAAAADAAAANAAAADAAGANDDADADSNAATAPKAPERLEQHTTVVLSESSACVASRERERVQARAGTPDDPPGEVEPSRRYCYVAPSRREAGAAAAGAGAGAGSGSARSLSAAAAEEEEEAEGGAGGRASGGGKRVCYDAERSAMNQKYVKPHAGRHAGRSGVVFCTAGPGRWQICLAASYVARQLKTRHVLDE